MATETATAVVNLQREVSKKSVDKESVEAGNTELPAIQATSVVAVHTAVRPEIDYSSTGAFFGSVAR
jgi:hypothetical protein